FLVTEDDCGTAADPLDRFDRGNDAERTVELAAVGHRVEVRAGPDAGVRGPTDEVASGVDFHSEAGLAHPLRRELVRAVLALAAADAIRAAATADGIQLVKPLVHPHAHIFACRADMSQGLSLGPVPPGSARRSRRTLETEGIESLRARGDEDAL